MCHLDDRDHRVLAMAHNESISNNQTFSPLEHTDPGIYYVTVIFGIVIAVITIAANIWALVDIFRKKKLFPFHYYLINLTVVDLCTGLFAQTNMVLFNYYGNWPLGEKWCNFWIFFDVFVNAISYVTMTVISTDRVVAVAWPIFYQQQSTKKSAVAIVCFTWIIVAVPFLIHYIPRRLLTAHPELDCSYVGYEFLTSFGIVSTIIAIYAPLFLITANYVLLITLMMERAAKKRIMAIRPAGSNQVSNDAAASEQSKEQAKKRKDRDRKPFILMAYLIIFYYISCAPMAIYSFRWTFDEKLPEKEPNAFTAAYWMQYLNSMVNPFLYAMAEKDFILYVLASCRKLSRKNKVRVVAVGPTTVSSSG